MKKIALSILLLSVRFLVYTQSVAINTDGSVANSSAILDIKSTAKGLLIPRMTTAQRNAIAAPAKGLMVFDITLNQYWYHNGSAWTAFSTGSATNYWTINGTDIYNNNAGNVGIGTGIPGAKLHIAGNVKIDGNNTLEFGAGITYQQPK
ncbi:MAG: hypothetical protein IPP72_08170 [Chitinophagaceae bacterium]|nr:hypothetical protein [Chitinophagaceae bacterium]